MFSLLILGLKRFIITFLHHATTGKKLGEYLLINSKLLRAMPNNICSIINEVLENKNLSKNVIKNDIFLFFDDKLGAQKHNAHFPNPSAKPCALKVLWRFYGA